jgi:SAM-dependent methyltransferase
MTGGHQRAGLLDDAALEASAVVANCAMNRERQLAGVNSYARELGFSPLDVITAAIGSGPERGTAAWLDLCCGTGRALIQAARQLHHAGLSGRTVLTGVDLVNAFGPAPRAVNLELVCAPAATWVPGRQFDLITCVHGLHYIGDKLALLTRAAGWLTSSGRLVADLDLSAIQVDGGPPARRRLAARLRAAGLAYNPRRHQITCTGRRDIGLPYIYLGADDRAGPGYTGQPAVHSHYAEQVTAGDPAAARYFST